MSNAVDTAIVHAVANAAGCDYSHAQRLSRLFRAETEREFLLAALQGLMAMENGLDWSIDEYTPDEIRAATEAVKACNAR